MQVVGTCQSARPSGVLLLSCESNLLSQVDSRKISIGYQKRLGAAAAPPMLQFHRRDSYYQRLNR